VLADEAAEDFRLDHDRTDPVWNELDIVPVGCQNSAMVAELVF
jgi:hypothetical protein